MTSNRSPLLPPSQSDLYDTTTWQPAMVETPAAHTTNNHEMPLPRLVGTRSKHFPSSSTSTTTTAYEPHHSEKHSPKNNPIASSPAPLRATLASWSLEAGAMILSISSLIAIVAVLYREDGKSLDRWSLAVSLNTVVSTLGTFARITLAFALSACVGQQKWSWLHKRSDRLVAFERFDEAAKGPWGGARLFIWLKARHWAALGALVIVGTVAFDPFLQAVIFVEGRLDELAQGPNATIGYAQSMYGGTFIRQTSQGLIPGNSTTTSSFMRVASRPDFGVVGSIYNGLRNSSTSLEESVEFTCVTGNCTWPLFTSAGVCSSCVDVSASLEPQGEFGAYGVSLPWSMGNAFGYEDNYTAWSLPYANIRNYNARFTPEDDERPQTTLILNATTDPGKTIAHQDLETVLLAFATIRASDDFLAQKSLWNESRPTATECVLFLCANAYQAVSVNNALQERLIGSWSQKEPKSFEADYSHYVVPVNQAQEDTQARSLGKSILDANELRTDLQLIIPPQALNASGTINRRFNVSQGFIYSTIMYLTEFSSKPSSESINTGSAWTGVNNVGYPSSSPLMPMVVDALWNSTNLTTTFASVARSMTTQLRNTSKNRHKGTLHQWTIHVQVNWWYLMFPVAVLAIGPVYVVLVIIESTRLRLPVWKESVLPTLLYGFSDETQRLLREERHSKTASRTTVRYRMDEKDESLRLIADEKV